MTRALVDGLEMFQLKCWSLVVHWDAVPENKCPLPVVIVDIQQPEPYRVQSRLQSVCISLELNEPPQNLYFLNTTSLDTTRVVENITLMVGKLKLVVDFVFAALAQG